MTETMRQFLKEFSELLDKHDIEMEVHETQRNWESFADGITIYQEHNREKGFEYSEILMGYNLDTWDIENKLKEE